MIEEIHKIDKALDELLVNLGGMVLRLSRPEVTNTPASRQALARSVNQFSTCALSSKDSRVRTLAAELEATLVSEQIARLHRTTTRLTLVPDVGISPERHVEEDLVMQEDLVIEERASEEGTSEQAEQDSEVTAQARPEDAAHAASEVATNVTPVRPRLRLVVSHQLAP
jgi:hypothetical protein